MKQPVLGITATVLVMAIALTLIIPVLLLRSLAAPAVEEEKD